MRVLIKINMPTEAENPVVGEPGFNDKMRDILGQINAESASFALVDGRRVDFIIVNIADVTELPRLAEPFFRWLHVRAEFLPQMDARDVERVKPRFDAVRTQNSAADPPESGPTDLDSFLRGEVNGADFHHAHHVRAGFEILKRHDFPTAIQAYVAAIKDMTAREGNPGRFHQTLTIAFLALIAERAAPYADYEAFIAANPDLLDKAVLMRWYAPERLGSALARRTFVLPDPVR